MSAKLRAKMKNRRKTRPANTLGRSALGDHFVRTIPHRLPPALSNPAFMPTPLALRPGARIKT